MTAGDAADPTRQPTLQTQRLTLVPMRLEHLPLLHQLDSDPEVMRHLLGRARTPEEIDTFWAPRCAETIAGAAGLGWWVGFADDATSFVGWWDLGRSDSDPHSPIDPDHVEIGWRVARRHWGQGYATEGARALLDHAFTTLGLTAVYAETATANLASQGVMRKLGMTRSAASDPESERWMAVDRCR